MIEAGIVERRYSEFEALHVRCVCACVAWTPTTWTVLQHDGPNHLGLCYNGLRLRLPCPALRCSALRCAVRCEVRCGLLCCALTGAVLC